MRRIVLACALFCSTVLPAQETTGYNSELAELSSKLSDLILIVQSLSASSNDNEVLEEMFDYLKQSLGNYNGTYGTAYTRGLDKLRDELHAYFIDGRDLNGLNRTVEGSIFINFTRPFYEGVLSSFSIVTNKISYYYPEFLSEQQQQTQHLQDIYDFLDFTRPFYQDVLSSCVFVSNNVAYYYPEFLTQQQQQTQYLQNMYNHIIGYPSPVDYSQVLSDLQFQISSFDGNVSAGFSQLYQELSDINSKLSTQPDYTGVLADMSTTLGRIDQYTALIEGILAHLQAVLEGGMLDVQVVSMPEITIENPTDLTVVEGYLYDIKDLIERLPQSFYDYSEVLDSIDLSLVWIHDYFSDFHSWLQQYKSSASSSVFYTSESGNFPYVGFTSFPDNSTLEKSGNAYTDVFNALVATIQQGEFRRVQLDFVATNVFAILSSLDSQKAEESFSNEVNRSISELGQNQAEVDSAVQSVVDGLNVSIPSLSSVQGDVVSFANVFRQSESDYLPPTIFLFKLPTVSISPNGWEIDTENGPSLNVNPYEGGMDAIFTYIRYFFTVVWWSMGVLFLVFLCRFCFGFARAAVVLVFGSAVETSAYNEGGFLSKFSTWN